jgi:hypothetical protein
VVFQVLIKIPESVETIGEEAFSHSGLSKLDLPKNIKLIKAYAFGETAITELKIENTFTFEEGKDSRGSPFENCKKLVSVEISAGFSVLPMSGMFMGCTALSKVVLPGTLKDISPSTFRKCYSLKEIVLPNSITTIGDSAF